MVTLLQAYEQTGDAKAVVAGQTDLRWQLVLGCLGGKKAPFSQGVLSQFRERMVKHDLDKKQLNLTVEIAKRTNKFGWQHLRAALDSSPLIGAGRVLDTWNLIGRALSTVVSCAAKATRCERETIIAAAHIRLSTVPSRKTLLDIDWDDAEQCAEALAELLAEDDRVEAWVSQNAATQANEPPLRGALAALHRVLEQDIEPDPTSGRPRTMLGVAKNRVPSLGDTEMRHGRKSKHKLFNGYKRHLIKVIDADITVAAEVLPANAPEQEAMAPLVEDLQRHGPPEEVLLDRGYLASPCVSELHSCGVKIRCKPWHSRNGGRFVKDKFGIRLDERQVVCPAGEIAPISKSWVARFASRACTSCELRQKCTTSKQRTVTIH